MLTVLFNTNAIWNNKIDSFRFIKLEKHRLFKHTVILIDNSIYYCYNILNKTARKTCLVLTTKTQAVVEKAATAAEAAENPVPCPTR